MDGRGGEMKNLLRAIKDKEEWKAMIPQALKEHEEKF